jgi:hypothetical protein
MALTTTISREMANSYKTSITSGHIPDNIYMRAMPLDWIDIMSDLGTPMNDLVLKGKKGGTTKYVELPYGEGDIAPTETTLASSYLTASDGDVTTITLSSANIGQVWGVLLNKDTLERMLILEINGANYTVRRGFGASSAAASDGSSDAILYLGPAHPEGAPYVASPTTQGDREENYCQILEYTWTVTHRGRIRPSDEVKTDRFRHEKKIKMKEAALHIDSLLLWGTKNQGDGSATNPSSFAGLIESTSTNSNPISGPLELIDLLDGFQDIASDVGKNAMGHKLMMGWREKRIFNSFFKTNRRYTGSGDIKMEEDGFSCDFGKFSVYENQHMTNTARIILLNDDDFAYRYFEGGEWSDGLYSTDGWFDTGFIRCDLGPIWPGDRRRCQWHSFDLADTSYPNLDVV